MTDKTLTWEFPPLVYTLAQIRFSRYRKLIDHIDNLQEKFSEIGYPRSLDVRQFAIPPAIDESRNQWEFMDSEKRTGIILQDDSVILHTSNYLGHQDFINNKLRNVANALHETMPNRLFVERIGIRYIDAVVPTNGKSLSYYLKPGMLLPHLDINELKLRNGQHAFIWENSQLNTKLLLKIHLDSRLTLPADLMPCRLQPSELKYNGNPSDDEFGAMLDVDHFQHLEQTLAPDDVILEFLKLREGCVDVFTKAVTDDALSEWQGDSR